MDITDPKLEGLTRVLLDASASPDEMRLAGTALTEMRDAIAEMQGALTRAGAALARSEAQLTDLTRKGSRLITELEGRLAKGDASPDSSTTIEMPG